MENRIDNFKELLGEYKNNLYRALKIDLTKQIKEETNIEFDKATNTFLESESKLIKMYEELEEELKILRKFRNGELLKKGEFLK